MQNIDLICVGKLNAPYFAAGVAEYQKRLGAFCNFRIIELPEAAIADKNASDAQISKALDKEATAILSSLPQNRARSAFQHKSNQYSAWGTSELYVGAYFIAGLCLNQHIPPWLDASGKQDIVYCG